jgi:2-C-methyl-D-erythritol 4-phosphate cytidylyltransferase
MSAVAIIVAGGLGLRMGGGIPKQLLPLGGKPILERTLDPFLRCESIADIIIAAPAEYIGAFEALVRDIAHTKDIRVIAGGAERQDSVERGLSAIEPERDVVVVHDAVRPFITPQLIAACVEGAERFGAVTAARPLKETVKAVVNGMVVDTPDRSRLWITLTPQAFRLGLIRSAHEQARRDGFIGTDDCMLVERIGLPVRIIEGDDRNIKITTPADLAIAGALLTLSDQGEKEC